MTSYYVTGNDLEMLGLQQGTKETLDFQEVCSLGEEWRKYMQGMIKAVKGKKDFRLEMIGEVLCWSSFGSLAEECSNQEQAVSTKGLR